MQIEPNESILAFFKRCRRNLNDTRLNDFLDRRTVPGQERYLQRRLKQAGAQEFDGPEASWPGLFLPASFWLDNPYHRNVTQQLMDLQLPEYHTEVFAGHRLFNLDAVQPDRNRELMDWMKLRALDQDVTTLVLQEDEIDWMLDAPSEIATNDPYAAKAHGSVITFGLGIGYFLYMALRNPNVDHVTVIERNEAVIDRFREYLLPLFPDHERITIQHADAFDIWEAEQLSAYDYIYADIWQSGEDGLFRIHELLEQAMPDFANTDFWIEDSCVVPLRTLIFLHFEELLNGTTRPVHPDYESMMNNVRRWFAGRNDTISDPDQLKDYLYDRQVLRSILGGKTCA